MSCRADIHLVYIHVLRGILIMLPGGSRYDLYDLFMARISWVGSVLHRSCTTYRIDRCRPGSSRSTTVDRDMSNLCNPLRAAASTFRRPVPTDIVSTVDEVRLHSVMCSMCSVCATRLELLHPPFDGQSLPGDRAGQAFAFGARLFRPLTTSTSMVSIHQHRRNC